LTNSDEQKKFLRVADVAIRRMLIRLTWLGCGDGDVVLDSIQLIMIWVCRLPYLTLFVWMLAMVEDVVVEEVASPVIACCTGRLLRERVAEKVSCLAKSPLSFLVGGEDSRDIEGGYWEIEAVRCCRKGHQPVQSPKERVMICLRIEIGAATFNGLDLSGG
jgi:hypothetical protein